MSFIEIVSMTEHQRDVAAVYQSNMSFVGTHWYFYFHAIFIFYECSCLVIQSKQSSNETKSSVIALK